MSATQVTGLELLIQEYTSVGEGIIEESQRSVFMDLEHDGETLMSLVSVELTEDRRLQSRTTWTAGSSGMKVVSQPTCIEQDVPPPTVPSLSSVLEDTLGPDSPAESGYTEVRAEVWEKQESVGIVRVDLSNGGRAFESLDARSGLTLVRVTMRWKRTAYVVTPLMLRMECVAEDQGFAEFRPPSA